MQASLEAFGRTLAEITSSVFHYWRPKMQPPFICWLSSEKQRGSDDRNRIKEISASIELYTDRKEVQALEELIETKVLFDIPFQKYQERIREENMVQTAYQFVTTEKI